jgi:hypothetical protein
MLIDDFAGGSVCRSGQEKPYAPSMNQDETIKVNIEIMPIARKYVYRTACLRFFIVGCIR